MKIAVYGSAKGEISEEVREKARIIGREIAKRGHTLITGACPGLPYEANLAAYKAGGKTIGFSPAGNLQEHINRFGFPTEGFSELKFISQHFPYADNNIACLRERNIYSATENDAAVIITGAWGTLNEFEICRFMGKPIGVLAGTKGLADFVDKISREFDDVKSLRIIYYGNPVLLLDRLEKLA
jgi:predicted Rossmann-fold nucleotide-binding protein